MYYTLRDLDSLLATDQELFLHQEAQENLVLFLPTKFSLLSVNQI